MREPTYLDLQSSAIKPVGPGLVAWYLASRRLDSRMTLAVACVMAALVGAVAVQGVEALRPVPDATFAFRV